MDIRASKDYKNLTNEPRNKKKPEARERLLQIYRNISPGAIPNKIPPSHNAAETGTSSKYRDMHHYRFK
jgi:hypothetical protein